MTCNVAGGQKIPRATSGQTGALEIHRTVMIRVLFGRCGTVFRARRARLDFQQNFRQEVQLDFRQNFRREVRLDFRQNFQQKIRRQRAPRHALDSLDSQTATAITAAAGRL